MVAKARIAGLTAKQEQFCIEFFQSNDPSASYRKAYDTKGNDTTVFTEAQRLLAKPAVQARITELRNQAAEQAVINQADVLRELWDNSQKAKTAVPVLDKEGNPTGEFTANWAASNQALIAIGNNLGMFDKGRRAAPKSPLDDVPHADLKVLADALRARREAAAKAAVGNGNGHHDSAGPGQPVVSEPRSTTH